MIVTIGRDGLVGPAGLCYRRGSVLCLLTYDHVFAGLHHEFELSWTGVVAAFQRPNRDGNATRSTPSSQSGPAEGAGLISRTQAIVFIQTAGRRARIIRIDVECNWIDRFLADVVE